MSEAQIPDGAAVTVSGYTNEETGEAEARSGVVVSGGHAVDGEPFYEVHVDGFDFSALVEASRVEAAAPLDE